MPFGEGLILALQAIFAHKLRSFFTLLGVIVSVAFLVAVVAVIQGMNAYVRENLAGAIVGSNAFQVRRTPIAAGLIDDETIRELERRPIIDRRDVDHVRTPPGCPGDLAAIRMAYAALRRPLAEPDGGRRLVFGVTAPYQVVQDYRFVAGEPLSDVDVEQRRYVAVLVGTSPTSSSATRRRRSARKSGYPDLTLTIKGVTAKKGSVLGQSFDGFIMIPLSTFESVYGRRRTTVISVKMADASTIGDAMAEPRRRCGFPAGSVRETPTRSRWTRRMRWWDSGSRSPGSSSP